MGEMRKKYEVGDRVTYEFNGQISSTIIDNDGEFLDSRCKILKIERPTYEVIEEVNEEEEKEELLTDYERGYMKRLIDSVNDVSGNKITNVTIIKQGDCDAVEFYTETLYLGKLTTKIIFTNLKTETNYGLGELGLENG